MNRLNLNTALLLLMAVIAAVSSHSATAAATTTATSNALLLTPQPVVLRAADNSKTTTTVYTTDAVPFLNAAVPRLPEPNKSIVQILLSYPRDGQHKYWWPKGGSYDGSTTDVVIAGKTVMKGEPQARTFCCGLTLEVFYRYAAAQNPQIASMLAENEKQFKKNWFCLKINSPGPLDALDAAAIGNEITDWEQALPGDFIQLWRNDKSGHSVIFINWLRDAAGQRVGLQYWSTQTGTNGIGFASEAFGTAKKQINTDHFSITRPTI